MHPTLVAQLNETISFRPIVGSDVHGYTNYGAVVGPVRCRISYPTTDTRFQDRSDERIFSTATIYLEPASFDRNVVPVGSLALIPDNDWRPIIVIDQFIAPDGTLDHWRLRVGQSG